MNIYDDEDLHNCCLNYIRGLKWTFDYYFKGVRCWKYIYNYRHTPSMIDILNTMNSVNLNLIKFKDSKPYSFVVQLLSIFPRKSINLIPRDYRKIVDSLSDYYPDKYEIDTYYKRYMWQCEPILPLIDYDRLNKSVKKIKSDFSIKEGTVFIKQNN